MMYLVTKDGVSFIVKYADVVFFKEKGYTAKKITKDEPKKPEKAKK